MPAFPVNLFAFDGPNSRIRIVMRTPNPGWFLITRENLDMCLQRLMFCVSDEYHDPNRIRNVVNHQSQLSDDECVRYMSHYQLHFPSFTNGRIVSHLVEWN